MIFYPLEPVELIPVGIIPWVISFCELVEGLSLTMTFP